MLQKTRIQPLIALLIIAGVLLAACSGGGLSLQGGLQLGDGGDGGSSGGVSSTGLLVIVLIILLVVALVGILR